MQLATSQRPHPPPVPPRPSRQVVAEALKRSPRPPCPTRQAPPPPNTKPWRSDQQQQQQQQQQQLQQQVDPSGGRTIVYESLKEYTKDGKDESVSNQARNTDRSVEDARLENGGKTLSYDQHHGAGSERLYFTGNVPVNIVRKRNSLTEDQRPQRRLEIRRNSRGKDLVGGLSYVHRERCRDSPGSKDQRRENSVVAPTEKLVETTGTTTTTTTTTTATTTTTTTKPPVAVRAVNVSFEDEHRVSSSSPDGGRVTVSHAEKCNGDPERADDHDTRPTPTCRSCPGEQQLQHQQQQQETFAASGKPARNGGVKSVSSIERSTSAPSVDRAATTLLVVDEPERKIAPNAVHEDSNDNDSDNNIHRQDWLEAGVRYSSTQITLYGEDDEDDDDDDDDDDTVVGRDRINGYDHREEERITDLDFIR